MSCRKNAASVVVAAILIAVGSFLVTGCGKSQMPVTKVKGTVEVDGKTLTSGNVLFRPEKGPIASGTIQPDGTFVLTTYPDRDGAVRGTHKVAVTSYEEPEGDASQGELALGRSLLPARYADPDSSGITVIVGEKPENVTLTVTTGQTQESFAP